MVYHINDQLKKSQFYNMRSKLICSMMLNRSKSIGLINIRPVVYKWHCIHKHFCSSTSCHCSPIDAMLHSNCLQPYKLMSFEQSEMNTQFSQ